jgi:hypothetical protein
MCMLAGLWLCACGHQGAHMNTAGLITYWLRTPLCCVPHLTTLLLQPPGLLWRQRRTSSRGPLVS